MFIGFRGCVCFSDQGWLKALDALFFQNGIVFKPEMPRAGAQAGYVDLFFAPGDNDKKGKIQDKGRKKSIKK